jgi:hypothetical protein
MTETIDQLIQTRFEDVANPLDTADWRDVLVRARREHPRARTAPIRLAVVAAVAAAAATVTAAAFGLPQTVVDFFEAAPAPQNVRTFFGDHHAAVPNRVSPDTKLGEPRKIMTATFDANNLPPVHPTLHTLYVAPREDGGFCFVWTDFGGGCADPEEAARAKTDPAARPLGVDWLENDYVGFVDGWIRADAQTLEARFADGTTSSIPVTRVSDPIGAGFFAYVVPVVHLTRDDALTSLVALDADGDVVARQDFALTKPLDEDVMQTLPDGRKLMLPRRAVASRAQEIVKNGPLYLWVMPRTGGGTCFLYGTGTGGGGQGCTSPRWLARLPEINGGDHGDTYFAQVKPDVAAVELRYRNGATQRLTPTAGFVLHATKPGTRLVAVAGLDGSGKAIFRQQLPG